MWLPGKTGFISCSTVDNDGIGCHNDRAKNKKSMQSNSSRTCNCELNVA